MNDISTDPNVFALSLLLPFALAVAKLLAARRWGVRLVSLCVVNIIALGLFLTMSRGSLLALVTMLLVFLVRLRTTLRMTLPILALVVILSYMPEVFFVRLQTAVQSGGAGRMDIWEAGFWAIGRYGLVGAGVDNFPLAYNEYAGHSDRYRGVARDAHNVFLAVWVETGIVGLMLLLAALKSQLGEFRHVRHERGRTVPVEVVAVEAACWGMLVASFFEQTLWRKAFWVVWIFAAMSLVIVHRNPRASETLV